MQMTIYDQDVAHALQIKLCVGGELLGVVIIARDHSLATNKQCCKASRVFCCHLSRLAHDFRCLSPETKQRRSYKWLVS